MIGMALRQLRANLITTAALTGAVVAVLGVHGAAARGVRTRLARVCASANPTACQARQDDLRGMFMEITPYLGYLTITTVLIAVFWGAPLVSREVETGTAALAWCQSITRRRWLASRLITAVSVVGALGLVLGFSVTWWLASFTATPQYGESVLTIVALHGPLLAAMWIAGLLIGVLVGTVIRRMISAMAVTAVITFAAAIAFNLTSIFYLSDPVGEIEVLADQLLRSIPLLVLGAIAALAAFKLVRKVSV